jgi:hypothetical protein
MLLEHYVKLIISIIMSFTDRLYRQECPDPVDASSGDPTSFYTTQKLKQSGTAQHQCAGIGTTTHNFGRLLIYKD